MGAEMSEHAAHTEALRKLTETRKLTGQQRDVLVQLVEMGRATSGEVLRDLEIRNINAWRGRFAELRERGLIREVGQRKCTVSGRVALVWTFTGRDKPLTSKRESRRTNGPAWKKLALAMWAIGRSNAAELGGEPLEKFTAFADQIRTLGGKP